MHGSTVSRIGVWLAAMFCIVLAAAEPAPPPAPSRYFNDYAGLIPMGVANRLNLRLENFERTTSNQLLVAIFPSLPEGTFLEDYTVKTFKAWKPGGKQDNGVILFVFVTDRKVRIEVGYGLEGALPDSLCGRIIAEQIAPAFKSGNYALGLEQGIEGIIKATRNEYEGTGRLVMDAVTSRRSLIIGLLLLALIIWLHMGDTVFQRTGRFVLWNLIDIARFVAVSSARGSGSSSGSFRGGGGRSGGGGASGSW